ncbi:hypothetical protein QQS21_004798 [Conoideocrella luteorostrata]|uniref:Meiotically up-regulated gene 190 protein n=1 Tax=Conoideocrella luteorostrata TaxID=1105319 RepID=A0AAJ0FUC7_9HYPO|nr:hypothetical protein QQS21_004798 [Conoideocrella luteorostrata]
MPPAMDEHEDVRRYQAPYSSHRPVPTISRYREEKAARQANSLKKDPSDKVSSELDAGQQADEQRPEASPSYSNEIDNESEDEGEPSQGFKETSQVDPGSTDVKQRRKELKSRKRERAEREVTDPVTHLPVTIHDFTDHALKEAVSSHPAFTPYKRTATGLSTNDKSGEDLKKETKDLQRGHDVMQSKFPPPDFDMLNQNIAAINRRGLTFGLGGVALVVATALFLGGFSHHAQQQQRLGLNLEAGASWWRAFLSACLVICTTGAVIAGVRQYTTRKIGNIFQDEIWDAHRQQLAESTRNHETETTIWLNSVLGAVWPLVNPDLFASLADTLEDVMQASLPKLVRMVSVEDIGQGSESIRILGIQWLPTGAASRSVAVNGELRSAKDSGSNDNSSPISEKSCGADSGLSKMDAIAEGMEGEEGDFVNLEVAFAYRTRSSSRSLKDRTKDMHLYLAFYLPGNIKIPVWVDLLGIIGSVRLRMQLCPDPPFFSLCTLTFMGQPKVDVRCVPLSRRGLNIMDVPLISNFVQSAIDAAVAEYVAPKSLTLDLKDMLAGDDFKKDTVSKGVLMVRIKRGYDFKMGDSAIPLIREGSSDPYVSVGWAKFGKVLWSTRILKTEMEPHWDETCFVLVTPEEVNIEERIRVQLWDSDRFTADDDLGRIEVCLKDLMHNARSRAKMWDRTDGFRALKAGDDMPGKLEWSVGYFPKTRIQQCQFDRQTHDPKIRSMEQLKEKVDETCERKLREFMIKEDIKVRDEEELEQQIVQEMKTETDAMIISAPPPDDYPSGLFSIQIHNITGLEIELLNKRQPDDYDEASDEEEEGDGLPSSYCTVIINHSKTFKTRTKPQNSKPFFNAGCERFIRDWRDCEVFVSVRDARLHEDNPLLGIVHLPLGDMFKDCSQVMGWYPLSGGVGRGRIRLSMVWRSVRLQAPRSLLGWQYGTVNVDPVALSPDCPNELKSCKLKLKTDICMGKMYPSSDNRAKWTAKKEQSLHLAVKKRYSSCMAVEFRDKGFLGDKVPAFCILWLKDIPDEEEETLELPIWKGDYQRASVNCMDECGEKIGVLKVKVTFWAGMGHAHSQWASRNQHTRDVVEVIDTARDNLDTDRLEKRAGVVDEEASSDSDSSDDEKEELPDGSAGNKQNVIEQVRDYKRRDKALHRQHRGLMQWKIPRTARWVKHKIGKVEESVSGLFDHQNKQPGIETEV